MFLTPNRARPTSGRSADRPNEEPVRLIRDLGRRKMRSTLTITGILIGIMALTAPGDGHRQPSGEATAMVGSAG